MGSAHLWKSSDFVLPHRESSISEMTMDRHSVDTLGKGSVVGGHGRHRQHFNLRETFQQSSDIGTDTAVCRIPRQLNGVDEYFPQPFRLPFVKPLVGEVGPLPASSVALLLRSRRGSIEAPPVPAEG